MKHKHWTYGENKLLINFPNLAYLYWILDYVVVAFVRSLYDILNLQENSLPNSRWIKF
jgi:hypothetical protein